MKAFCNATVVALSMLVATPLAAYFPSADDACLHWQDKNDDGKLDKNEPSVTKQDDHTFGRVPTRPPDEIQTEVADSRTTTTKIWRRVATEDEEDFVEVGSVIEEKLIEVREEGRLLEVDWSPLHGSDGTSTRYTYSPEGLLIGESISGPGTSFEETVYGHDSDGNVATATYKFRQGAWGYSVTEYLLKQEGGIVVRAAAMSYEEDADGEGRPPTFAPSWIATYEYDRDLRLVARREVTIKDETVRGMSVTRFRYDCKKR